MAMTEKQKIGVGVGVVAVLLLATMGTASASEPDDKPDDDGDDPDDSGTPDAGDYGGYEDEDEPPEDVDLGKINLGDLDPGDGGGGSGSGSAVGTGLAPMEQPESEADNLGHLNDLLDVLITPEPRVGRFYQIRQGDTWASIAARALKAVHPAFNFGSNRVRLMECMSASQWNRALYGKEGNFNAPNFPAWTSVDNVSIREAFFNNNQNAIPVLRAGEVPSAEGFGSAYGLLWLPIIRADDQANITCLDVEQDDGSGNPGIEPPTVFKDLLVALGA